MKVTVLGAGGPAGVNTLRALWAAGHECVGVDGNPDHRPWIEPFGRFELLDGLDDFGADVVLAQPDKLVLWLAQNPDAVRAATFLPDEGTIWACQDKLSTSLAWYRQKLRDLPPKKITEPWPDMLHLAKDDLGLPFWLRATRGAGAKGAIKVDSLDQAYHWIRFWQTRGADFEWLAEEFFPGRDLAWSSIWFDGELVTSFARERLEYLYPHLTPEGLTGTPTIARIVHDALVNEIAEAAVLAIDERPHGIYSVDLKEDAVGRPRPTEINAGRGFTTFGLWSLYNPNLNFMDIVVRLAVGEQVDAPRYDALPHDVILSRHIDCGHIFTRERVAV